MLELNPVSWWRRLLALPNDSRLKALVVMFLLALVSATAVSVSEVTLRPLHIANLERERQARMDAMIAAVPGLSDILMERGADALETRLVDLRTRQFAPGIDAVSYDQRAAAADPDLSIALASEEDIARIGRRANLVPVHLLLQNDEIVFIVLPVRGSGYGSTIYANLVLEGDLRTIAALSILEQSETPGIGARIEEEEWLARWQGKQIADENGALQIEVVMEQATGPYQVDGITGATRTSNGVTNMLRFWLGDNGFGPFLTDLREGEISP